MEKKVDKIEYNEVKPIPPKFVNWLMKHFDSSFLDSDWKSEFSSGISLAENRTIFIEKFGTAMVKTKTELKQFVREMAERQQRLIAKEEAETISKWKEATIVSAIENPQTEHIKGLVTMATRKETPAVVIFGRGGYGKSFIVRSTLTTMGFKDYEQINTYSTPLALYKWLYHNRQKLCILDDVASLLNNNISIGILKGAIWGTDGNKDRKVSMETTSKSANDVPHSFEMEGSIIILANTIPKNEDVEALLSRANPFELKYTYQEKIAICEKISKNEYKTLTEQERADVWELLKAKLNPAVHNFTFRTLNHTFDYYNYCKDLTKLNSYLDNLLVKDEETALIMQMIEQKLAIEEQHKLWIDTTGKSVRWYQIKKKKLKEMIKTNKRSSPEVSE